MLDTFTTVSTVPSGRARLRTYATKGGDPALVPVVFLHAGVCDSRMWHHELETIGAKRRAVAFDRRGYGETPAAGEPYTDSADVVAVMDSLGIERAVVVGCSMGGRITLDTLSAAPDRVAGIVLVAGAIGGWPEEKWTPDPRLAPLERRYEDLEKSGDKDALARFEARYWLDGPLEPEGRVKGPVRELFLDMARKASAAPETAPGDKPATGYASLPRIAKPALVVWGPLDESTVVMFMKHAAATIPGARALEIAGTAHIPNLERPDVFTPALQAFLDGVT